MLHNDIINPLNPDIVAWFERKQEIFHDYDKLKLKYQKSNLQQKEKINRFATYIFQMGCHYSTSKDEKLSRKWIDSTLKLIPIYEKMGFFNPIHLTHHKYSLCWSQAFRAGIAAHSAITEAMVRNDSIHFPPQYHEQLFKEKPEIFLLVVKHLDEESKYQYFANACENGKIEIVLGLSDHVDVKKADQYAIVKRGKSLLDLSLTYPFNGDDDYKDTDENEIPNLIHRCDTIALFLLHKGLDPTQIIGNYTAPWQIAFQEGLIGILPWMLPCSRSNEKNSFLINYTISNKRVNPLKAFEMLFAENQLSLKESIQCGSLKFVKQKIFKAKNVRADHKIHVELACQCGRDDIACFLLEKGSSFSLETLKDALDHKLPSTLAYMLKHRKQFLPDLQKLNWNFKTKNDQLLSPLMQIARLYDHSLFKAALDAGFDPLQSTISFSSTLDFLLDRHTEEQSYVAFIECMDIALKKEMLTEKLILKWFDSYFIDEKMLDSLYLLIIQIENPIFFNQLFDLIFENFCERPISDAICKALLAIISKLENPKQLLNQPSSLLFKNNLLMLILDQFKLYESPYMLKLGLNLIQNPDVDICALNAQQESALFIALCHNLKEFVQPLIERATNTLHPYLNEPVESDIQLQNLRNSLKHLRENFPDLLVCPFHCDLSELSKQNHFVTSVLLLEYGADSSTITSPLGFSTLEPFQQQGWINLMLDTFQRSQGTLEPEKYSAKPHQNLWFLFQQPVFKPISIQVFNGEQERSYFLHHCVFSRLGGSLQTLLPLNPHLPKKLNEVDFEVFETYLEFIYQKSCKIKPENFKALASFAVLYGLDHFGDYLEAWIRNFHPIFEHWEKYLDQNQQSNLLEQEKKTQNSGYIPK